MFILVESTASAKTNVDIGTNVVILVSVTLPTYVKSRDIVRATPDAAIITLVETQKLPLLDKYEIATG